MSCTELRSSDNIVRLISLGELLLADNAPTTFVTLCCLPFNLLFWFAANLSTPSFIRKTVIGRLPHKRSYGRLPPNGYVTTSANYNFAN